MTEPLRVGISADFQLEAAGILEPFLEEFLGPYPTIEYDYFTGEADVVVKPEAITDFDALLTLRPRFNAQSFVGVDRLALIARWGVGYDVIDVPATTAAHVLLSIATGAVNRPVAEAILTFFLALAKKLPQKDRLTRTGRWDLKAETSGLGLRGKTIGSLGLGNIGAEMFRLLEPFEPGHKLAHDPYVSAEQAQKMGIELVDIETLFARSDFLAVNCLLNDQTRGLVNRDLLRLMKPTAYLVNTARGAIINEVDLLTTLQNRQIAGAGLDVFEQEPLPVDHPLTALDNVILTPHGIAWTDEIYRNNSESACNSILTILRGDIPERRFMVNPDVTESSVFQAKLQALRQRWMQS
jgi:phosphoglycerate dehydrogenase-like enzyme